MAVSQWLGRGRTVAQAIAAVIPGIALASVFVVRAAGLPPDDPGVGADLPAAARLALAADLIDTSLGAGGKGFTFTVVERSTLFARPGGPRIEVPDPIDRFETLRFADQYYVGGVIAEGSATPAGFWLQMHRGPATPEAPADFANAPITLSALTVDGVTYRNDGDGWYETDTPPGIGLDTATLALLPTLLRTATAPAVTDTEIVGGTTRTTIAAGGTIDKAPGLMAVDAATFTEINGPIEFKVDTLGRLIGIHAVTRNLRMATFDLSVDVVIEIRYDTSPGLPKPDPTLPPAKA